LYRGDWSSDVCSSDLSELTDMLFITACKKTYILLQTVTIIYYIIDYHKIKVDLV
jgi:hypothetical protein